MGETKVVIRRLMVFVLVVGGACAVGCEFNCGSLFRRAERKEQKGGLTLAIKAWVTRTIGVSVVGAPHVPVFLPVTRTQKGYSLSISVADRGDLVFLRQGTATLPSKEELEKIAKEVQSRVSPDKAHVALHPNEGKRWIIVHLLEAGPPFLSKHSLQRGAEPNWAAVAAPMKLLEELIVAARKAGPSTKVAKRDFWRAIVAQPASSPVWPLAAELWPAFDSTHSSLMWVLARRASGDGKDGKGLVRRILAKASETLADRKAPVSEVLHAVDAILIAGRPEQIRTMDTELVARWRRSPIGAQKLIAHRLDRARKPMRLADGKRGKLSRLMHRIAGVQETARKNPRPRRSFFETAARMAEEALKVGSCTKVLQAAELLAVTHPGTRKRQFAEGLLRHWLVDIRCAARLRILAKRLPSADRPSWAAALERAGEEALSAPEKRANARGLELLRALKRCTSKRCRCEAARARVKALRRGACEALKEAYTRREKLCASWGQGAPLPRRCAGRALPGR